MKKLLTGLGLWAVAAVAGAVELGDKAPPLSGVTQWLNGAPVNPSARDGRTTYVIEFWATWCPPCRETAPHMVELAKRFADRQVVVVGVTQEDEKTVAPFLKEMGIGYRIALDTTNSTERTYGKSVQGIPHAFIVDTNGLVVWQGHPMDGMDDTLQDILDGKYDPQKAKALQDGQERLMSALQSGNIKEGLKIVDAQLADNPRKFDLHQMKLAMLMESEDRAAYEAQMGRMLEVFKDSSEDLNQMAMMFAGPSPLPLKHRDLGVALRAALRAEELTQGKDAAILDTLGLVYAALGLIPQAIETEKRALGLTEDAEEKLEFQGNLEHFQRILEWRKTAAAAPAPAAPVTEAPAKTK